jgi:glycosyltransferase 2 family protein
VLEPRKTYNACVSGKIKNFLWLIIALITLAVLSYNINWAEFKASIVGISWSWAIWAVVVYFFAQTVLAGRWLLLLRVQGIHISLYQVIKLTYLGLFYNNMMPGSVGGDLLKGWYITHHSDQTLRIEAAVTVFVDRLTGLIGMVMVAVLASFVIGSQITYDSPYGQIQIRWVIWAIFAAMVGVSIVFLSRHVRRLLLLSYLLEKLPFARFLRKADNAIRIYRHHIPTMLISLLITAVIQWTAIAAVWMLSQSLHFDKVTFVQCLIIMPIVWVIGVAIPVPGGLGIIEGLITYLFCLAINPENPGQATEQALALAMLNRIMICTCSLPGALVPVFGGHLPKPAELEMTEQEENS